MGNGNAETIRRVLTIIDKLETNRHGVRLAELAEELNTSQRQVRKYLCYVEAVRPLVHERGHKGKVGVYYLLKR